MNDPNETLFTSHLSSGYENLIQYNKYQMSEYLVAVGYAEAARRLAESYRNQPWDDVILMPFLFLWRQAIELQLKANIRSLASLRRKAGDTQKCLLAKEVDKRLRDPRKVGHNLEKLLAEHDIHSTALGLEEIPAANLDTLALLAALDNGGTGFRYAGVLKAPSANLNFQSIGDALDSAFRLLEVVIDAATNGQGA